MHFGKIVKRVVLSRGLSAKDFAELLGRSEKQILELYEQEEWTSGTIKAASVALEHDFGKYVNNNFKFDFLNQSYGPDDRELLISVRYSKGKEFLLKTWLQKMMLIAKSIGLEIKQ